jgi:hypothetical protein
MNIGLLVIATGKYKIFLNNLIKSADKYFLEGHNVTYFIFTDEKQEIITNREIVNSIIEHRPWPYPTLLRYKHFSNNENLIHFSLYENKSKFIISFFKCVHFVSFKEKKREENIE